MKYKDKLIIRCPYDECTEMIMVKITKSYTNGADYKGICDKCNNELTIYLEYYE